jgi:protoheme IX farnesyltransferase
MRHALDTRLPLAWSASGLVALARDTVVLAKPRITALVLFTSAIGAILAPGTLPPVRFVPFLLATAVLVASANTLNCWLERESDGLMHRTRDRPLPAGRLAPTTALALGLVEGSLALSVLAAVTNALTVLLGAIALASYVLVYTPLKRVSPWAVVVGAIPGAIPPLMGWTAVTGTASAAGFVLFGILFFWQLPHFIAISLYLEDDYRRGGMQVLSVARGELAARRHLFLSTLLLVAWSFAALPLGLAGLGYLASAIALGAGFVALSAWGLRRRVAPAWARCTFAYSLVYLPLLIGVLLIDAR